MVKHDTQQQADRIFSKALDLPLEDRDGFLRESCGEDLDLRAEVDLLLGQYGSTEQALSSSDPSHTVTAGEPEEGAIAAPGAGDVLGNFRLLERLESEPHDQFLAEAEGSRDRVLLQVLGPELEHADVRRIRVESEYITRVDHPGLLALLDVGTAILGTGPRAFTVTSAGPFEDFPDWLVRHDPATPARLDLACRLTEAVAFAHGRGLLDGHLHPGRIVIDDHGQPLIRAMGLPRLLRSELEPAPDGLSPRAPEAGETPWSRLDVRIDLFALGGLLDWLADEELASDLRWQSIISRARAHDPADRYGSAELLLEDLRRLAQATEDSSRPDLASDVRRIARRHPIAALTALGVLSGLLIVMLVLVLVN